jgi:hypothetical protein
MAKTYADERLDELSRRMDYGFDRVDREFHLLRSEMHTGFGEVRREIDDLRKLIYRGGCGLFLLVATSLLQNL